MFNIQNKYNSFGCYCFRNNLNQIIYIGKSKNVHRRLFSQHFKKNGTYGHLPIQCYKDTCKIEIIKLKDHAQTVAMEQYLIDVYTPKYNDMDKRKDLFNESYFENRDYYKQLEKWILYYTFREYDFNKMKTTTKQNRIALVVTFIFFVFTIGYMLKGLL